MDDRFSDEYELRLSAVEDDIDELQHVNNLVYLRWSLKAAVSHSSHVGWPGARYRAHGAGFIVRSHNIKYRYPAVLGDEILIRTWIVAMERVSSLRRYDIVRERDAKLLARVETNWAFVDFQSLKLQRIPDAIRNAFAPT
ncbi:MAG TPA: acyl-CoA thioesterase [Planctomycetaceae bacterium]|nr:thioesterase [Blastopirellula sp.]HAY81352.1 acyl-CoA thioesterase [Planctomycetaceae bacterium]